MKKKRIVHLVSLKEQRFKITYIFFLIIIFGLLGRLINLQVFSASELQRKAKLIQFTKTSSLQSRRSIVDRNNRLIAYDKTLYRLWAHPKYFNFPGDEATKIRNIDEVVNILSPILNVNEKSLLEKFKNKKVGIELFDEITENQAKKIKNLHISGLDLVRYSKRYYPQGNLYSNIVGFVNYENKASAGLELHLDNQIQVVNKGNFLKKGGDGTPLPDHSRPGDFINDYKKLVLTIDSRLQKASFKALNAQVEKWDAKKGFAVVMNVNNGEILSLVSSPSYDPNQYWNTIQNYLKVGILKTCSNLDQLLNR